VHLLHTVGDTPAYLPLGTTAHKQGRIAGETAVGGSAVFAGSLGTQVVKVFELAVARMTVDGLSDLDLSYTPPFGSPWDAVQMAAQTWTRQTQGRQPTQAASHETRL
jgi:hypothetical protein